MHIGLFIGKDVSFIIGECSISQEPTLILDIFFVELSQSSSRERYNRRTESLSCKTLDCNTYRSCTIIIVVFTLFCVIEICVTLQNENIIWYSMQTTFPLVRNRTLFVHHGVKKTFKKGSAGCADWVNYTIWDEN